MNFTRFLSLPAPRGLTVIKGLKNIVITREFAEYCLYDELAVDLYHWMHFIGIPDEFFFQTLSYVNRTLQAETGEVKQNFEAYNTTALLTPRHTHWHEDNITLVQQRVSEGLLYGIMENQLASENGTKK